MRIDFSAWQRKCLTEECAAADAKGVMVSRDQNSLSMTSISQPQVDTARMSASAVINTDAIDYDGEVILASGVRLGNYANNPVVMWDHGRSVTPLPIGTSRSPDAELMIQRSDRQIEATSFCAQSHPFAVQVFALIDEGVVRATSINVVPSVVAAYRGPDGREVLVTEESDMVEWSWTALGVNPEALRSDFSQAKSLLLSGAYHEAMALQVDHAVRVLNRNSLGGDLLMPAIRKSLLSMVPAPRGMLIKPFDEEVMSKDTLTGPEIKSMNRQQLKSLNFEKYDDETQKRLKAAIEEFPEGGDGDSTEVGETQSKSGLPEEAEDVDDLVEEVVNEVPAEETVTEGAVKLGAKVLMDAFEAIQYVHKFFGDAVAPVENDTVRAGMESVLADMGDSLDSLRGLFSSAYPDLPPLGATDTTDEDAEMAMQMKAMLASNQSRRYRVMGLQSLVGTLAGAPNLTTSQKKSISAIGDKLGRLVQSAAEFKPSLPAGYIPESELHAMQQRYESKLDDLVSLIEKHVAPAS